MSPQSAPCWIACFITATCSSVDLEAGAPRPHRLRKERNSLYLGTPSPNPWDLARFCHPIGIGNPKTEPGRSAAHPRPGWYGLAPESALGSHPCVALSSAPVPHSVNQKRLGGAGNCSSLIENCLRNPRRRGITDLVLRLVRWPVLKWPRMAGFQVAAEDDQ